jgi:phenylalanyl-tRNA synthetase beta chain
MLESGLEVISYNLARRNMDLLLFEHGFRYEASFAQHAVLALYASGHALPAGFGSKAVKADGYFLKSVVQHLLRKAGIQKAMPGFEEEDIFWKWKNKMLCRITEVPAEKCRAFDVKERVWYAEIDWALWTEAMAAASIRYQEVPRFPAVRRDLALVLDKTLRYADVQRVTERLKLQPLQSYHLFDVFEGESLGAGKKSMALSYTFQLADRTLTDAETEALMRQLSQAYSKELGAQIRE